MNSRIGAAQRMALNLVAALTFSACAAPNLAQNKDANSEPYVLVLGTAQDGGLPQLGCQKECCDSARANPELQRNVTSLLLVDPESGQRFLFDASPDLPEQIEMARHHGAPDPSAPGRPPLFDGVFLTHAHIGHYTGLMHLGREAYGTESTPVFASSGMLDFLTSNGPWSLLFEAGHMTEREIFPGRSIKLSNSLQVTAYPVPHRGEFSDTVCFFIEGPKRSLLYIPDIDKWHRWDRDLGTWLERADFALLDGTFFGPDELPGRDMSEIPHPFIVETLDTIADLPPALRARVYFTHLNHSNPAANPKSDAARTIENAGAHILRDAQILGL